jgi:hypothetical protein
MEQVSTKILLVSEKDNNKTIITIEHSYLITKYIRIPIKIVSIFSAWKSVLDQFII